MRNFLDDEILDLMEEIQHELYLCRETVVQASQPEYGIPKEHGYAGYSVFAIIMPEKKEIAIANLLSSSFGDLKVYLRYADVALEEFESDTRAIIDNTVYQIEYLQTFYDRGHPVFHHIRLVQGQTQTLRKQQSDGKRILLIKVYQS